MILNREEEEEEKIFTLLYSHEGSSPREKKLILTKHTKPFLDRHLTND